MFSFGSLPHPKDGDDMYIYIYIYVETHQSASEQPSNPISGLGSWELRFAEELYFVISGSAPHAHVVNRSLQG